MGVPTRPKALQRRLAGRHFTHALLRRLTKRRIIRAEKLKQAKRS